MRTPRQILIVIVLAASTLVLGGAGRVFGVCGPFTDTADDNFCPFVLEVFYLGVTTGTTPTTYDPASNVSRLQMATFLSRTVDRVLQRGSRRAALQRFWTSKFGDGVLASVTLASPRAVQFDGADLWVDQGDATVVRVRASDGALLETWTAGVASFGDLMIAMGRVLVVGQDTPGKLYQIDPSRPPGGVTIVASTLGGGPKGIAFDGAHVWTSNSPGVGGSVSILTPGTPWTVTTVSTGFTNPNGILYDGSNVWVTDRRLSIGALFKLDGTGAILKTVTLDTPRGDPIFDGANIWVPLSPAGAAIVRASSGAILATVTQGALPGSAFDGERVLLGDALFKAADLTFLGVLPLGGPACNDGTSFWVVNGLRLSRF